MRLILILSCIILTSFPLSAAPEFTDVLPGDPYAASVQRLRDIGVLFGYPDGTFRGGQCVTRAELAVVVARMMEYFIASLPAGVSLQSGAPGLPSWLAAIDPVKAGEVLASRSVILSPQYLNSMDRPATLDEVSELVYLAVARLIEHVSPPWEGGLRPSDAHPHGH